MRFFASVSREQEGNPRDAGEDYAASSFQSHAKFAGSFFLARMMVKEQTQQEDTLSVPS
jgi:hypothetical protein